MSDKDLRLVQNMYFNQSASIKHNGKVSGQVPIKRGVRQGDSPSPDYFSLYSEMIMREIDGEEGVKINGINVNNLRLADDIVLMALSEKALQNLLDLINRKGEKFGMEINFKKTKCMVCSKLTDQTVTIHLNDQPLKTVDSFKYLGSLLTSDCKSRCDIRQNVAKAKKAFSDMKSVLANLKMPMKLRLRILRCYIEPILLYSSETWTLMTADKKTLMATEMWFLRRMLKIKWTDKVTNEEVLRRAGTRRWMMNTIAKRQTSFFGHIIRKQGLENLAMTGKILGRKSRGRRRRQYLDQIKEWTGIQQTEVLLREANTRNLQTVNVH